MVPDQHDAQVRTALYERYDALNALYQRWEEKLSRFHIPRPVSFIYHAEEISGGERYYLLGVHRSQGKWCIVHACQDWHGVGDEPEWQKITECSAQDRVRAAPFMVKLEEMIPQAAEEFIAEADAAIQCLKSGLSNMPELLAERAKLNGQHKSK